MKIGSSIWEIAAVITTALLHPVCVDLLHRRAVYRLCSLRMGTLLCGPSVEGQRRVPAVGFSERRTQADLHWNISLCRSRPGRDDRRCDRARYTRVLVADAGATSPVSHLGDIPAVVGAGSVRADRDPVCGWSGAEGYRVDRGVCSFRRSASTGIAAGAGDLWTWPGIHGHVHTLAESLAARSLSRMVGRVLLFLGTGTEPMERNIRRTWVKTGPHNSLELTAAAPSLRSATGRYCSAPVAQLSR